MTTTTIPATRSTRARAAMCEAAEYDLALVQESLDAEMAAHQEALDAEMAAHQEAMDREEESFAQQDREYRDLHPACPSGDRYTPEALAWALGVAALFDLDALAAYDAEEWHDAACGKAYWSNAHADRARARDILGR
jgi:ferric-dicitrate binding protein FerR (iron transport regulator)